MGFLRSEEEVDKMIEEMKRKSKSKYLTQGVVFNRESKHQMAMLKFVLMRASSFSGYVKELIAEKMEISIPVESNNSPITFEPIQMIESKKSDPIRIIETVEKKDTGNFLL